MNDARRQCARTRTTHARRDTALLALTLCLIACAGTLVSPADREVRIDPPTRRVWQPATPADLPGLYESTEIHGEVAASLWKIYYFFNWDGRYSGAALVFAGDRPRFQVLSGQWSLDAEDLDLHDGAPPSLAWVAGDLLRLQAGTGEAILRRVPLR